MDHTRIIFRKRQSPTQLIFHIQREVNKSKWQINQAKIQMILEQFGTTSDELIWRLPRLIPFLSFQVQGKPGDQQAIGQREEVCDGEKGMTGKDIYLSSSFYDNYSI